MDGGDTLDPTWEIQVEVFAECTVPASPTYALYRRGGMPKWISEPKKKIIRQHDKQSGGLSSNLIWNFFKDKRSLPSNGIDNLKRDWILLGFQSQ
ncbi:unnamed protein product [Euphydryas editha]|uniref:Uncharacterized protein n=1 Tax=Euphydryas editha TaxID=104508 RepID=A0AAU9TC50_EUPED|nr:unnamed protein product [Euphydryas editha]